MNHFLKKTRFPLWFFCCAAIAAGLLTYILVDGFSVLLTHWMRLHEYWRFLIIPVSLYFVWIQRHELSLKYIKPFPLLGSLVLLCGCIAYLCWKISIIDVFIEIGIFTLCISGILLFLGTWFARRLFFPLFYLIFMTTILVRILSPLTIIMQQMSSYGSFLFLRALDISVLRDGIYLRLPHLVLEVATVCSGTNQLIALIAFALPLGMLRHRFALSRILLIICTIPITIFTNVIRILLIAFWNFDGQHEFTHGPNGILDLPLIYPLALVLLFALSQLLRMFEKKTARHPAQSNATKNTSLPLPQSFFAPVLLTLCFLAITTILSFAYRAKPVCYQNSLEEIPKSIGIWQGKPLDQNPLKFNFGKPNEVLARSYTDRYNTQINLYVARFANQNVHKRILSYYSRMFNGFEKNATIPVDSVTAIHAIVSEMQSSGNHQNGLLFFCVDDSTFNIVSDLRKKNMSDALRKHKNNAMIVVIYSGKEQENVEMSDCTNFAKAIYPSLKKMQITL